jgi:HK97 family phage major capsid protein
LEPLKVSALIAVNEELARSTLPAAIARFGNELRRACALATDNAFLAAIAATAGVTSNASTGLTAAAFVSDLDTALQAVSIGATSKLYLILPPNVCKTVALLRDTGGPLFPSMTVTGGTISGVRVIVSDAAEDTATLVDASQVASESDLIILDRSTHASLQLDDNPTSGAYQLGSLWQRNMVGMKAERMFGVELLRADAAALITGLGTTT